MINQSASRLEALRVGVDLRCLLEPHGSGVATYTRLMLLALKNEAHQLLKFTAFTSGWKLFSDLRPLLPANSSQRHIFFPNKILNMTMAAFKFPAARRCFGDVQIVWQPNPLFIAPPAAPHFVTLHDISFVRYPQFFSAHTKLWYLNWVRHWLKMAPDNARLIVDSNYVQNDVLTCYPRWRQRITVLPPPAPSLPVNQPVANVSQLYGLDKPYIIGLGTIEPRKNISSLIVAYKNFVEQHDDFDLVLVGYYGRGDLSNIARLAGSARWRVRILGYLPPEHREAVLSRAFCLVYPSYYEGFGYPPLEAMARGVPVVASAVSSLPEILGDSALFIDPYRGAEEIAAALTFLAADHLLYKKFQLAGLERVKKISHSFTLKPLLDLWQNCALV